MKKAIINATQLVTCKGGPKSGTEMQELHCIADGGVLIEDGIITMVGTTEGILLNLPKDCQILDVKGHAVLPGFVDSHTHFIFGGYRDAEFAWRLKGESYMEIMNRGGGIWSTVLATRQATYEELLASGKKRLEAILEMGVTTIEGKSGYGMDQVTELKQLRVMEELNQIQPVQVVPTFMGAHSIPEEYRGREKEFLTFLLQEVLPLVKKENLAKFVDIFCEKNVYSLEDSRYFLEEAQKMGFLAKIHGDEIHPLGGAQLAADLSAVSADHLLKASLEGIRAMVQKKVVATLLPATAFSLKEDYANARAMIHEGACVALASDFNPGSCFTHSIPLIIALACLQMDMTIQETINGLTINGAAALGMDHLVGSIEVGKQADLLVLAYPSIDFLPYHTGMNLVETVIKKGEIVMKKQGVDYGN